MIRNLPFALCTPEGGDQLRALIDAGAAPAGARARRLQPLTRKEDGRPMGVAFVLLELEGNGRVDVGAGSIDQVAAALEGREVGGRALRAARWLRPGPRGGGRTRQQQQREEGLEA